MCSPGTEGRGWFRGDGLGKLVDPVLSPSLHLIRPSQGITARFKRHIAPYILSHSPGTLNFQCRVRNREIFAAYFAPACWILPSYTVFYALFGFFVCALQVKVQAKVKGHEGVLRTYQVQASSCLRHICCFIRAYCAAGDRAHGLLCPALA